VNKRKENAARKNKLISYDKLGQSCDIALSARILVKFIYSRIHAR